MKRFAACTLTLLALLLPRAAGADDEVVDVIVSDEMMERLIQTVLEHNPPEPSSKACSNANETCLLDHADFSSSGTELDIMGFDLIQPWPGATVSVPDIIVTVPSTFYWKTESCVSDPSCSLTTYDEVQEVDMLIRLSVEGNKLCGQLAGFDFEGAGLPETLPPPQCTGLSLGIEGLSDDHVVRFRGISVDASEEHVVVRQEYQPKVLPITYSQSLWQAFYFGQFPTPISPDASVFIGSELILEAISEEFQDGIISQPHVFYDGPITETWIAAGNAAIVELSLPVTVDTMALEGIPCTLGNVPADANATVTITLDAATDELVTDIQASADVDEGFAGFCFIGPGGEGLISSAIVAAVVESLDFAPPASPPSSSCTSLGGLHFECRAPAGVSNLALPSKVGNNLVGIDFDGMVTTADGIHLSIDATMPSPLADSFSVNVSSPKFGVHGSCSNFRIGYEGSIWVSGLTRVFGLDFNPTNRPGWALKGKAKATPSFTIYLGADPDAVPNIPDLIATLRTSSGLQSFLVEAPEPATAIEWQNANFEKEGLLFGCARWMEELLLRYDPRWDIDPPHKGLVEIMTPDLRNLLGYGMLVELTLEVRQDAWVNGTMLLDLGHEDLDAFQFRVLALTAEEAHGMSEREIIGMIQEHGLAELIELPAELMGAPESVAVFELGAPYEDEPAPRKR